MPDRRAFLTGLVSLPLIGGGVTLIGKPTAPAVAATPLMLANYDAFLGLERYQIARMLYGREGAWRSMGSLPVYGNVWEWFRADQDGPRTRAATVLSTVGLPLN